VEDALREAETPGVERLMAALRRRSVVGSPQTVRTALEKHAESYQVDEIMAVTICYDFAARKRSYELLAEAFQLTAG
jgi:alkanesulfonate monooxygenase SsuD/methylene tetrahydromethanopterin reductase-like flavin-dependent oxidoreductase (luciferase family)